jgi:hypothetical protein
MPVLIRFLSIALTLSALSSALVPVPLLAHPGGRDSYGCHHDLKHGGYHCHAGPLAGQSFASQAEMLAVLNRGTSKHLTPSTPVTGVPPPTSAGGLGGGGQVGQVCIREHRTQQIMCGEPVQ